MPIQEQELLFLPHDTLLHLADNLSSLTIRSRSFQFAVSFCRILIVRLGTKSFLAFVCNPSHFAMNNLSC